MLHNTTLVYSFVLFITMTIQNHKTEPCIFMVSSRQQKQPSPGLDMAFWSLQCFQKSILILTYRSSQCRSNLWNCTLIQAPPRSTLTAQVCWQKLVHVMLDLSSMNPCIAVKRTSVIISREGAGCANRPSGLPQDFIHQDRQWWTGATSILLSYTHKHGSQPTITTHLALLIIYRYQPLVNNQGPLAVYISASVSVWYLLNSSPIFV